MFTSMYTHEEMVEIKRIATTATSGAALKEMLVKFAKENNRSVSGATHKVYAYWRKHPDSRLYAGYTRTKKRRHYKRRVPFASEVSSEVSNGQPNVNQVRIRYKSVQIDPKTGELIFTL